VTEKKRKVLTRRNFLIAMGLGGTGVLVGIKLGVPFARLRLSEFLEAAAGPPGTLEAEATAWFQIKPDNTVKLYIPKAEMGQGVHTALAQIAAEELEIKWEQLEVVHADTGQGLDDDFGTGASNSVSSLYQPLREAAATMREMLRVEAARQLALPLDDVIAQEGQFIVPDGDQEITYGQVVENADTWEIPEEVPALKPVSAFRLIGQDKGRVDLWDKVLGTATFGYDVRRPDMLYGAVAHAPQIGARLLSASPGEAGDIPGVVQVVIEEGFVGVVAETREQAYAAVDALDIEWETVKEWQQADIDALVGVGQGKGIVIQKEGNPDRVFAEREVIRAEYRTPMAFHAHLEPQTATADVQPDRVQVWTSTQFPVRIRGVVAEALGRDEESIVVTPTYLGGGFGSKIDETAALEAARLSAAVGRPVHIGWNRAEDFHRGFLRPPTHHILQATLDQTGRSDAIKHQQASGEVAFPFLPGFLKVVMGADFGSWRGAFIKYDIPHRQTTAWLAELPVPTGWWRGLGLMANNFAIESFVDELAHAAGSDPLEFRLRHLPEDDSGSRMRRILETAAERSGWDTSLPAGYGRGVAISDDVGTMGSIIMGLSSTLIEEAIVEDGRLVAENFNRYPLLTMEMAPEIEVVLLESSETPHGLGEPPIGPVPAAVANAIFAASGQRLRELPLRLT
jgi:isoquinoline 1-oxidoreductase beta subunit